MADKKRLDIAVFERGFAKSREQARALIMAGNVFVNNQKSDKPGNTLASSDKLEVRGGEMKYVSRGGYKLEKAVDVFNIILTGAVCCDIGASTGGFTDCLLQNGAARVYSIDVGYGQLDWRLRNDPRVTVLERTNFRYLTAGDIPETPDFAAIDVSFISLAKILPALYNILNSGGRAVCLIKPQFEAGRGQVGKNGVVREPEIHESVLIKTAGIIRDCGFGILGADYSPIKGPSGNIEFLAYIEKDAKPDFEPDFGLLVEKAHKGQ